MPTADWKLVQSFWADTHAGNEGDRVQGYTPENDGYLKRSDVLSLRDKGSVTDEAMRVIGNRMFQHSPNMVWANSFTLERMYPLEHGGDGTNGQPLRPRQYWANISGQRAIGSVIEYVVMPHWVPGHWCLALADFVGERIVYYDSFCDAPHAINVAGHIKTWLTSVCDDEVSYTGTSPMDFEVIVWKGNSTIQQRRGSNACGVCVLMMAEILVREGSDDFDSYGVVRSRSLWPDATIAAYRAKYALRLLTPSSEDTSTDLAAQYAELEGDETTNM